jgi:hypothetical protein
MPASTPADFSVVVPVGVAGGQFGTTTVTDANNNTSEFSRAVQVQSVPGIMAFGSGVPQFEGKPFTSVVTSFTYGDTAATAADFSATIDWGDNTPVTAGQVGGQNGQFSVIGGHTYAEEGVFPVRVTIHNSLDNRDTVVTTLGRIQGAPLTGAGVLVVATVGVPVTAVLATFSDTGGPDPISLYSATVSWGDQSAAEGGGVRLNGSVFEVVGTHTYSQPGQFAVHVVVVETADPINNQVPPVQLMLDTTATVSEAVVPPPPMPMPMPMPPTNDGFVAQAYLDLLHRPVDPFGLGFWTGMLANAQVTREGVALGIQNSDEYRDLKVEDMYQQMLHRDADPSGFAVSTHFLRFGAEEQLAAIIAGSTEYFQNRGGGTIDGFLNAIYNDALGRAPDDRGRAVFANALLHGASPAEVANAIFGSLEYRTLQVAGLYEQMLHRSGAGDPGVTGFIDALVNKRAPDATVIANIVGSAEYFANL